MLSRKDAVKFLEDKLGIDDVESKAQNSKLCLVREYVKKIHRFIPFQNLTLIAKKPEERCVPSIDDILTGCGGICYSRGLFTHRVFTSLGYNSYQVACSFPTSGSSYTHVTTIVTDIVQDGDAYLVEVGACFPSLEPVPIHALPVQFKHAFLECKFVREKNQICRYHRKKDDSGKVQSSDSESWKIFYVFEDIPRDEEFLLRHQTPIYTIPNYGAGWFLTSLQMSLYPEGKAVTLSKCLLKVWDMQKQELEICEELKFEQMEAAIQKYFPMLDHNDIRCALENLKMNGYL